MDAKELILRNFEDVRRRSTLLWQGLSDENLHWRPDHAAMSAIELIRHVLQADYGWHKIITKGDMTNYHTPWEGRPHVNVQNELDFAAPYRSKFISTVSKFSPMELEEGQIKHPGNDKVKNLGDYLLRIAYHESVHAGQFLSYLRTMECPRPSIWD